jgi:long-chain acyl-CoA synthetase
MATKEHTTILEAFKETAGRYPHKTAVVFLGTSYSYGEILNLSGRLAWGLKEMGIKEGDKVIFYIPNSIQWIIAWLGVQWIGAVAVPITPIYTLRDLVYIAGDTGARVILCSDRNFGYVKQALVQSPLEEVLVSNLSDLLPFWKRWFGLAFDKVPKGKVSREKSVTFLRTILKARPPVLPEIKRSPDGMAEILYTGGTTKHPKGVPLTHELFLLSAREQLEIPRPLFPPQENVIAGGAPLFHILGQTCGLATLFFGGTLLIQPKVHLDAFMDSIQRNRAKTLIGVPALYRMILEHDRLDQYDLSSLKYCFSAGDVLPLEVENRWRERMKLPIYQGYGATETCGGIIMGPVDRPAPPRSMGRVVLSKEVKIIDPETRIEVPPGEPGELIVHSREMVRAYWNKPEETAAAFLTLEGKLWYRTGDIISRDEEDFYYFMDRTVDVIKHKGYRISASEIEAVLQEHPAVIESCVVGIPDPKSGERIKAFVVLKKDIKGVTGYDLIKWCRRRLVSYKLPQYIEFRDMLPKSKVGKLLRREIRMEERKRFEKDEKLTQKRANSLLG